MEFAIKLYQMYLSLLYDPAKFPTIFKLELHNSQTVLIKFRQTHVIQDLNNTVIYTVYNI